MGRCTFSITAAVVKLLPDPVIPRRVWKRSPRSIPSASAAIASGWSPAGVRSVTSSSAGIVPMLTAGYDSYSGTEASGTSGADLLASGAGGSRVRRSSQIVST